jgi:metal-responsive CopG/Arc/MetJ family transcriptional regulator
MFRIQLDLPEDQVAELDDLMKETNIATRKDLFNNALTLFQWAVKAKRSGSIVAALDEEKGTAKELVMPALESVSVPKLREAATVGSKAVFPRGNRPRIS